MVVFWRISATQTGLPSDQTMPGKPFAAGEQHGLGIAQKFFAGAAFSAPGNTRTDDVLRFVDRPEGGEFAGEGAAEGLQHVEQTFVQRGAFRDDLADDELDAQAALAAVLLGHVAEDAADRNRSGLFAAAAEAGFHLDVFAG